MDPNGLLLMSVLLITSFSPDDKADQKAIEAYIKQTGIDRRIEHLEREHVSEELRFYLGHGIAITRTIIEKRITIEWRFP